MSTAADLAPAGPQPTVAPALEVRDLVVRYGSGRKAKRATPAIDGVSFDIFRVDTSAHVLYKGKTRIHLAEKRVQVLELLLARPGDVVRKEEIIKELWPHRDTNGKNNLHKAIVRSVMPLTTVVSRRGS